MYFTGLMFFWIGGKVLPGNLMYFAPRCSEFGGKVPVKKMSPNLIINPTLTISLTINPILTINPKLSLNLTLNGKNVWYWIPLLKCRRSSILILTVNPTLS